MVGSGGASTVGPSGEAYKRGMSGVGTAISLRDAVLFCPSPARSSPNFLPLPQKPLRYPELALHQLWTYHPEVQILGCGLSTQARRWCALPANISGAHEEGPEDKE